MHDEWSSTANAIAVMGKPSHFSKSVDHFSELVAKKIAEYKATDPEEEAAREEGALIEASGYHDPASDPRWA